MDSIKTLFGKAKAWAMTLALGFCTFAPPAAEAGFTNAINIDSTARKNLENNTVYIVTGDYEVKGSTGYSAYTMAENSTAVIYIPSGKTLTLQGGKAHEKAGAGAGIEVPPSSTLIITGSGRLVTTGGAGANGGAGDSADDAICNDDDIKGGWGAAGGSGGGGAGAGIGGKGGLAGSGGSRPGEPPKQPCSRWSSDMKDTSGNNGNGGSNGTGGTAGGNVYVLGAVTVESLSGAKGNGGNGGSRGSSAWYSETWEYHAGWGGGGGGGGGGGAAASIGGGGGGGGGGGSGGNGGHFWTSRGGNPSVPDGGGGSGGGGSSSNSGGGGGGTRDHYGDTYGGLGGGGGSAGATGASGSLYADSGVHLTAPGRTASPANTHSAIEYTLTFDDDWRVASNVTVRFGYALPKAPVSTRYGYTFKGWYTGTGGTGTQYYDAQGDAVRPDWTNPGDMTLYAKWERNSEDLSSVTLWINDVEVVDGTDSSGDGWSYNARVGQITFTGAGRTYEIHGCDADGFAQLVVRANCTIKITGTLEMSPGTHTSYTPVTVAKGGENYSDVTLEVAEDAHCSLTGSSGHPAIYVYPTDTFMGRDNTIVIKARGALDVTGGDGAADIGLRPGDPIGGCGKIYIETYDNWFANIRPGNGLREKNGFVNDMGRCARIYSYVTSNFVYSVRMTFPSEAGGEKTIYRQRILGEVKDTVRPDADGTVWLWVNNGDYEWGEKLNASYENGDKVWTAKVSGEHTVATTFIPLNIKIDGEDIAHRSGPGWYTRYEGSGQDKVTLVITNAGPHVVTGGGNAAIDIMCDMALVISNLVLDATSWSTVKCAIWLDAGVTLDMTAKGTNSLSSSAGAPGIAVYSGRTLNLGGDGLLTAQGGQNGAGIGGGNNSGNKTSGKISISGGHITTIGGAYAAGIGSGQTGETSGNITISGGVVIARGGQYAAGIGGGSTGSANVTITGGTVFPTAGTKASAIGDGYNISSTSRNIFGLAAIYATKDGVKPAAQNQDGKAVFPVSFDMGLESCNVTNVVIEGDVKTCKDLWTDESGKLTLWLEPTNGEQYTITITAVDAEGMSLTKSWGYRMDNNGNVEFSTDMLMVDGMPVVGGKSDSGTGWDYDADSRILAIASGDHTISGSSTNGSINIVVTGDGVNISIEDLILATTNSYQSPFVVSNRCTVSLSGNNTIECICSTNGYYASQKGSLYTAAIEVPEGAALTIDGNGTLVANGGIAGAGIGSRGQNMDAGSITINGGYIYATGGWNKYVTGGGAGIGGGDGGGVASILVTGGYVHATGGKNACGVGTGYDGPLLDDSAFRVAGGTVLIEKGDGSFSDFITACGSVISPSGSKSIVIDGGSVRPKNFYGAANPEPNPVNSNGVQLVYAIFKGVGMNEGDSVEVLDDLWPQYNGVTLYADEDGMICIWGEKTNLMHTVTIQSPSIAGGSMPFTISADSNTVQTVTGGEPPDSREIDGKTCWKVEVHALPGGRRMNVTGIDPPYVQGTIVSDYTGKLYLYLPNGEYDFKVGAYSYHASVADATAVATYTVGILVGDVDIGNETGPGWTYDGTSERLVLNSSAVGGYRLSGTNLERCVSVYAAAAGVKVRSDRLVLKSADDGPFRLQNLSATLEFVGGTLSAGPISAKAMVSGGSFNTTLENAVAPSGATAYRVTINGFARNSLVEIENVEGLGSYDMSGIYADASGSVYLYLPNGSYYFIARSGGVERDMVVVVEDGDASAIELIQTGVSINGRDAAWLSGPGWRNEDGLVRLYSATNYVVTGTNYGAAVTLLAEESGATLVLDSLVMTNESMIASPIAFAGGSGETRRYEMMLVGTNVIHCSRTVLGSAAVELGEMVSLAVSGDGRLEAVGSSAQAGIGLSRSGTGKQVALTILSGEIVATGNSGSAGIGGSGGQEGFTVNIYGGDVTATGGEGAAGIGGGFYQAGGKVTVTNGIVRATGGDGAAGIGGGKNGGYGGSGESYGDAGSYSQSGGTVVARGTNGGADVGAGSGGGSGSGYTTITGGSLYSSTAKVTVQAKNSLKENVYCVTVPTGRPNFDVGAVMPEWDGYSLTGVKTDDEGKVYIWLPDGIYFLNIGGVPCRAVVDGGDTIAEVWAVGVTVNGEDVALRSGVGWSYDPVEHALVVTNDGCVVSGTNTEGLVYLDFTTGVSVVVSNLVLISSSEEASPCEIASNVVVTVTLEGENHFESAGQYTPAIHVPATATLSITNIDSVVSVPDLDDIRPYTNTVEIIEEEDDGHGGVVIVTNYVDVVTIVTNYYDTVVPARLQAIGAAYAAGIGGGYEESYGTIEICGGSITAKGGDFAAGIGSGCLAQDQANDASFVLSGALKIRGGEVDARSVGRGAGLGGGYYHSGGDIEIFGGTVLAEGGYYGAGIGAGPYARAKTISISGGSVTASGGMSSGAGIGGGMEGKGVDSYGAPRTVAISGGVVTARGGDAGGAGIGSGARDHVGMQVAISGGTVAATGGNSSSFIYGSDDIGVGGSDTYTTPTFYPLAIRGASVHATRRTVSSEYVSPAPTNGSKRVWCVTVQTQNPNERVRIDYLDGFSGSEIYADADGRIYLWLPNGTHIFAVGSQMLTATVANADTTAAQWFTGVTADGVDVARGVADGKRWEYDFGARTLRIVDDCVVAGTNTAGQVQVLAVARTGELALTVSNLCLKSSGPAPFTVTNGTVTVRLAGANVLDASSTYYSAGLFVMPDAAVVITNVEETARLTAKGGEDAAGIGGSRDWIAGRIFISGGTVTATGGVNGGAGIGSAYRDSVRGVVVSGGVVNATGGAEGGAGIGGGYRGGFDEISIVGGVVNATGGMEGGAGIGGGCRGAVGNIAISGGRITAYGSAYRATFATYAGAGIGGGDSGEYRAGAAIRISGGTIIARGGLHDGDYAADIGLGMSPSSGYNGYRVVISGSSTWPYFGHFDENDDNREIIPENGSGLRVYRAVLSGFTPNAKVEVEMSGYGSNDIYADGVGRISLWLANGEYYCSIDGRRFATKMLNGTVTTVEIPDSYGVEVDGVDVAGLTGDVWSYEVFSRRLTVTNACVISGTNTEGRINIAVDATEEFALTISNLYLKASNGAPLTILHGTNTLCLAGTNILDATSAEGRPGLHIATMYAGVVVTNLHDEAKLVASGGANAAGIGASNSDLTGHIEISGGIVEVTGGANGAGIGGSEKYGFVAIVVSGGTVRPVAGSGAYAIGYGSDVSSIFGSEKIVFTGGSIATDSAGIHAHTLPADADGTRVYPVALSGVAPNTKVEMVIDDYNVYDIYADAGGKIYPWLWEGDFVFVIGGVPHLAHVTSSGTVAEPWLSGVTANGTDVAYLRDESGKWNYKASKRTLYISSGTSPDDCVTVSGTNTEDYVHVVAEHDVCVAISNLNLKTTSSAPVYVESGIVTVMIAGSNTLDATGAESCAGLEVAKSPAMLVVTNLEAAAALEARGGNRGAGIGGGDTLGGLCDIAIYGGFITATGGAGGAGIGGGNGSSGMAEIYGGVVTASGGQYAAGIGSGASSGEVVDGTVYIYGGIVTAAGNSTGAGIGGGSGARGYVYISGGTVVPAAGAYEASKSIGNGQESLTGGEVRFTGGSVNTALDKIRPVPTCGDDPVYCVTVSNLTTNVKVAFDGLPVGYGTTDIYSDANGKVYLWLPENWPTPSATPLLFASPKKGKGFLAASAGTEHTFVANGYNYTVTIDSSSGGAVAEQGESLALESLRIDNFAVEDGSLVIDFTAKPNTWLYGFADRIAIRASETLPIPDSDDSLLDLSAAELQLEGADAATIVVPLGEDTVNRFFKVEGPSP